MDEQTRVKLMLESALPIDDVDQVMLPDVSIVLVWVDIQDRPDLADLAALHGESGGMVLLTWFAAHPAERRMQIGLRIEMRAATRVVFHLAFKVERYRERLSTLARYGQLWIVPGPPPAGLTGTRLMDMRGLAAVASRGVSIELEPSMKTALYEQLVTWKSLYLPDID